MRAAIYYGRRDVRIESIPEPESPGPGEVVLEVSRAGICGTDAAEFVHGPFLIPLHSKHHASGHQGPLILGHEFVGRIVAGGADVQGFAIGQRVVSGAAMWCGQCCWCTSGQSNLCTRYFVYGLHAHGGLAGLAKVPAQMCYAVPDGCNDESAAMAQPLAIALHALRRANLEQGQTLAVIGVGGIGAFILAAAHAQGLAHIIALDVDDARLERAAKLGASFLVNVRQEDPFAAISWLTDGDGADVVIEASGAPPSPGLALALVRRGGRVLLLGLQAQPSTLDLHDLVLREVELISSNGHVCDVDLPAAVGLLATTDLASTVLDRVIDLDALVPDGLVALAEGRSHGKILVNTT